MKTDNQDKTLEQLENEVWPEIDFPSKLVKTIYLLRKKILSEFTIEDLRISIGQNMGLSYLLPLAIKKLEVDILAEGDCYPGDLLSSVLTIDQEYWKSNKKELEVIKSLCEKKKKQINPEKLLTKKYEAFLTIYEHH